MTLEDRSVVMIRPEQYLERCTEEAASAVVKSKASDSRARTYLLSYFIYIILIIIYFIEANLTLAVKS
jgi:hypothetical protein